MINIGVSLDKLAHVDLRAVCGRCGSEFNRTCNPNTLSGQGRPCGKLGAFIHFDCKGSVVVHKHAVKSGAFDPFDVRVAGRCFVGTNPYCDMLFNEERLLNAACDDMASGEPTVIP